MYKETAKYPKEKTMSFVRGHRILLWITTKRRKKKKKKNNNNNNCWIQCAEGNILSGMADVQVLYPCYVRRHIRVMFCGQMWIDVL